MQTFEVKTKDSQTQARTGLIKTAHGEVKTPVFLPIGTKGAVKSIAAAELKFWGAEMLLANTYHLWQRPGDALIAKAGGLHKFMNWKGAIFTDSGGFQVFSLGKMVKVSDLGVRFHSDLDESPPYPTKKKNAKESVKRTFEWAKRAGAEHKKLLEKSVNPGQKLLG